MIDWGNVRRVLVIRLRSIGDTVLATPSLTALRRHLPDARIDILLEDWVAPLLRGDERVDNVIEIGRSVRDRVNAARSLRRTGYDVVFNLHGGTTASLLTRATGAGHRVGYKAHQHSYLHNHRFLPPTEFWGRPVLHSAEQQLALLGLVGVPVDDLPRSSLHLDVAALKRVDELINHASKDLLEYEFEGSRFRRAAPASISAQGRDEGFALIHPSAAFATKKWAPENFARVAEYLAARGLKRVAVAGPGERDVLDSVVTAARVSVQTIDHLSLPEVSALAAKARVFIGNDSGIAHIAAAVGTPAVVIFGSSNRDHWSPWATAPHEIVYEEFACQPCAGYRCEVYGEPKCIQAVSPGRVIDAVERVLKMSEADATSGA